MQVQHSLLLGQLRGLRAAINRDVPLVNHGGCAVVAGLVGGALKSAGLRVDVVTPSYGDSDWAKHPAHVRAAVQAKWGDTYLDPGVLLEWDKHGLWRTHLAVRFESSNAEVYTWDTDGLRKGGNAFGNRGLRSQYPLGEGLTVHECMQMAGVPHFWNTTFDRGHIPTIEALVHERLDLSRFMRAA